MDKEKLKENLTEKFKRKNSGEATQCFELCIHRNKEKHTIIVDKQQHKKALLEKLKTGQEKPEATPMDTNQKMTRPQHRAAEENMLHQPHQCRVGSLMYLPVNTRPDIAHVCSTQNQVKSNYDKSH